jgi:hypothetical protein
MKKGKIFIFILIGLFSHAQKSAYRLSTVAFYNVENLFDTENDTLVFDEDFTPDGNFQWTEERYKRKIANLAKVISGIGRKFRKAAPDILGLCEVENYNTLLDLVTHPDLRGYGYSIIHKDGPDQRGIDVALLYRKKIFIPVSINYHSLHILNEERYRDPTRDQLVVHGYLKEDPLYLIVNHWPSRRGGELKSRTSRISAAELNIHIIDSIRRFDPEAMIISMGDFNDNPSDYSFKKVLRTKDRGEVLEASDLYNPMELMFKNGLGSLAYRDNWSLFDQIYVSENLTRGGAGLKLWKTGIYNPSFLKTSIGPFRGYPHRTYSAGRYTGGYSDHFPVFAIFIKKVAELFGDD